MIRPIVVALALALCATGAWADRYSDCAQVKDLDRQIRGCTSIIERGKRESREKRVLAYNARGVAYHEKGDYDRAIADHTKAIALDPNSTSAYDFRAIIYAKRGNAYDENGEFDRAIAEFKKAIADLRKSLKIDPSDQLAKRILEQLEERTRYLEERTR